MPKADLILHPVRMKILLALAGQKLTAQQLIDTISDVAQATLYRHLNLLLQAGILKVVEERPVRGTVEKVYALNDEATHLSQQDLSAATAEDHMRYFMTFLTFLLKEFQRYVSSGTVDFEQDGTGYNAAPIYATDDEFKAAVMAMNNALLPYLKHEPGAGRRRRLLASIVIPDAPHSSDDTSKE